MSNYRVLPFIGKIKGAQTADNVSDQLEDLINKGDAEGWEFSQLCNVNIEVKPGCLSALLGAKESYVRYDMAIFTKKT